MKKTVTVLAALILSGCATDYLATGLPALEGKPVTVAIQYLGSPTEEKTISGQKIYSWIYQGIGSYYVPETVPGPSVVQRTGGTVSVYPGTSTYYVEKTYRQHCRVDLTTENKIVLHARYQGNMRDCREFNEKIKPFALTTKNR